MRYTEKLKDTFGRFGFSIVKKFVQSSRNKIDADLYRAVNTGAHQSFNELQSNFGSTALWEFARDSVIEQAVNQNNLTAINNLAAWSTNREKEQLGPKIILYAMRQKKDHIVAYGLENFSMDRETLYDIANRYQKLKGNDPGNPLIINAFKKQRLDIISHEQNRETQLNKQKEEFKNICEKRKEDRRAQMQKKFNGAPPQN